MKFWRNKDHSCWLFDSIEYRLVLSDQSISTKIDNYSLKIMVINKYHFFFPFFLPFFFFFFFFLRFFSSFLKSSIIYLFASTPNSINNKGLHYFIMLTNLEAAELNKKYISCKARFLQRSNISEWNFFLIRLQFFKSLGFIWTIRIGC